MKKLAPFLVLLLLISVNFSFAGEGKKYGEAIKLEKLTKISDVLASPDDFVGKTIKVSGKVLDVCTGMGCWIELESDIPGETIRVKVEDGEIVFPVSSKDGMATVEGVVEKIVMTKEEVIEQKKMHAEETGEEFDPSKVEAEAKTTYRIMGAGAVIIEKEAATEEEKE